MKTPEENEENPSLGLRLYRDLAEWYPLLTPVEDYAEEAAFYLNQFLAHCSHTPRTLLDLGSGAGHNGAHLKSNLACTLVDLEPAMLKLSKRLNPECQHIQGDMRTVRLGCTFDCILVHDAVNYMTSRSDLACAVETAFMHTSPGGVALFCPDFVSETFKPGCESGGSDGIGRALRYLEWWTMPSAGCEKYVADMAYMLRDEAGNVEVVHERHTMGLFSRDVWLSLIADAGYRPLAVPFPHSSCEMELQVFLGLKPAA